MRWAIQKMHKRVYDKLVELLPGFAGDLGELEEHFKADKPSKRLRSEADVSYRRMLKYKNMIIDLFDIQEVADKLGHEAL